MTEIREGGEDQGARGLGEAGDVEQAIVVVIIFACSGCRNRRLCAPEVGEQEGPQNHGEFGRRGHQLGRGAFVQDWPVAACHRKRDLQKVIRIAHQVMHKLMPTSCIYFSLFSSSKP